MDHREISEIFIRVLHINNMSIKLLPMSHTIHLISYNAQIAAALAGENGKTLGVMTREISRLSPTIGGYIGTIASTVSDVARLNANCMNKVKQHQAFSMAKAIFDSQNRKFEKIDLGIVGAHAELAESFQMLVRQLYSIGPVLESITEQTKTAEMISSMLRIEVARAASGVVDNHAFRALSDELSASCDEMKEIIVNCEGILAETLEAAEKYSGDL
jgi:methyl-accepting chemotaxis protein